MVRRALGVRRVGHAGTLDPFATGLLIVLVGRATRLSQYLVDLPKSYAGVLVLGTETETDDRTGVVVQSLDAWRGVTQAAIASAMTDLTGQIEQRPPAYSAKHTGGRRAHHLVRRGQTVELEPRTVVVSRFELREQEGPRVSFAAEVSGGTYVRALARDLGRSLGCGAHLDELRRTAVGPFRVEDAVALDALERDPPALHPPSEAVPHLSQLELDEARRAQVVHGQPVPGEGVGTEPVALVAHGQLIAIAEPTGGFLKPRVVLEG
jgi:tRNA pseudouridine55 synthase